MKKMVAFFRAILEEEKIISHCGVSLVCFSLVAM